MTGTPDPAGGSIPTDPGVPAGRNARIYALVGLAIVAGLASLVLVVAIWIDASNSGDEPVDSPADPSALQEALDAAVAELDVDGASVAVVSADGDRVHAVSGVADRGETSVDETTQFAIASITKTFTTALALRLAEEGRIDLEAPVDIEGIAPATLRDLLGHTSGLGYSARHDDSPWTVDEVSDVAATTRVCPVGSCYSYSDLGFVAAGLVIERATGEHLRDLYERYLFEPLELDATAFVERDHVPRGIALSDEHGDDGWPPAPAVPVNTWSAGAIVTTASDLTTFGASLLGGELLEDESLRAMQDTAHSGDLPCDGDCFPYGLGLVRYRVGGHDGWGHDGSSGAVLAHFPDEGITIAVLTTRRDSGHEILHRVMNVTPGLEDIGDIFTIDADGAESGRSIIASPLLDGGPASSPDGEHIAFGSVRDGNSELYIADADGSDVRRLTDDPADDVAARWSPDGTMIVFASNRGSGGEFDLYVMDADGGDVRRVTDDPIGEELPVFSPDGKRIAFNTIDDESGGDIVLINADGTNRRVIAAPANDWAPTWSPDGSSIAFLRGGVGIWVMAADGSNARRISPEDAPDRWPAWGPDGRIAFVVEGDLWTMAADGSDRRQVTQTPEEEFLASWSPDGQTLVYTRQ